MVQSQADDFDGPSAASGLQIGNFKVLGHYASGGTSELWIAIRDGAREICLLKQLAVELSEHETANRRFLREAHIAFRLAHKNIGRVLTAGVEGGRFCMSTEFIPGQNLTAILSRLGSGEHAPIPLSIVHRIACDVLDGIGYIHEATDEDGRPLDLVHRDLTPSNILVSFEGAVKIIDFGTARARIDDFKTAPGVVLGTPEYMSPEQALANPIDRRSDLYTFGIVLHELLTGRPVVPRGLSLLEALTIVRDRVPPPVTMLRADAPRSIDAVLERALQKNAQLRYSNAAELKAAFTRGIGVPPASDEALKKFLNDLLPDERQRIDAIILKGKAIAEAQADYVDEESLAQGAYTRTAPSPLAPLEPSEQTAILEEPPPMGTAVTAVVARSSARRRRGPAETPSVLEMPGTSVGRLTAGHLLKETDQLRRQVQRLRLALLGAGASLVAIAGLAIAWWLRGAPAAIPPALVEAPIHASGAAPEIGAQPRVELRPVASGQAPPQAPTQTPAATAPAEPPRRVDPVRRDPPSAPPRSAEPAKASEPPPPPPKEPPKESPYAKVDQALRELQERPRDSRLFDQAEAEIRAAAANAPPHVRRLIESDLAAAEKTLDPDALAKALRRLKNQ